MRASLFLVVGLACSGVLADEPGASAKQQVTPSGGEGSKAVGDKLLALEKEVDDSYARFAAAYGKAPDAEVERRWQEYMRKVDANCREILDLVKKALGSAEAYSALAWIVSTPRNLALPHGRQAIALLLEHHVSRPEIGRLCSIVGYYGGDLDPAKLDLLRGVMEHNADRTARGQACLGLARLTWGKGRNLDYQKKGDAAPLYREAERLFEEVVEKYADCPDLRKVGIRRARKTLGESARDELFELRDLAVGKTAPDIVGEDLDGTPLELNDYRGKVVVLTFWASWCGPCMGMVPAERVLVDRMKGRPFALLGVNGDNERSAARKAAAANGMTWRSFWNGGENGSITDTWNVKVWPTIYVIDQDGVIRFKQLREKKLDDAVELLVKKFEDERKPSGN